MTQEQNLLSGSVPRKLIAFALPLLLANILQSFYNVVDMLVVGQFVGETGLAAISNASKLCYIINSICIGMTMGGAVLIAQYKGANNKKDQAETFQMLSMLSLAASILLTVISLAGYQPLFRALKVPADALGDACDYMKSFATELYLFSDTMPFVLSSKGWEIPNLRSALWALQLSSMWVWTSYWLDPWGWEQ